MIKNNGMMHLVRSELIIHLKMKHENIVELYHFFEDWSSIYMVMEYCKYNMLKHLQAKKKFSERRARSYMRDIVSGLTHLHSHQIMHRDLKLANLLVTSDKIVKISDFGLSRYMKPNGECGTQLGTPKYMAYEVVLQRPYSKKADVWSLGCILYAFLEGRTPFHRESETVEETFRLIQNMDFQIPSHFSPEARDLVLQLLERDPNKRISLDGVKSHAFFRKSGSSSQEEPQEDDDGGVRQQNNQNKNNGNNRNNNDEQVLFNCFDMMVNNLVEFSTVKLGEISHQTRDGGVSFQIDREGKVHVIMDNRSMVVSSDSQNITYTEKQPNRQQAVTRQYHRTALPSELHQMYEHAYHFVELVKSKTPNYVYNSSRGRCMLMLNEPKPDAEMIFYADGLRLVYQRKELKILIHETNNQVKQVKLEQDLLDIVDSDVYKTPNCTRREQNCIADLKFGIEQCLYMVETSTRHSTSNNSSMYT